MCCSYDTRRHGHTSSKDWSDKKTLGGRAHFDIKSTPTSLVIDDIRDSDAGYYRCRVDFTQSPTRKARTNLTVISKYRLLFAIAKEDSFLIAWGNLALFGLFFHCLAIKAGDKFLNYIKRSHASTDFSPMSIADLNEFYV